MGVFLLLFLTSTAQDLKVAEVENIGTEELKNKLWYGDVSKDKGYVTADGTIVCMGVQLGLLTIPKDSCLKCNKNTDCINALWGS